VLAVHNDVATNDFSQLFRTVTAAGGYLELGGAIYPAAVAGSFFTQVVPAGSVHVGSCSNAAHWLRGQPAVQIERGMYYPEATGDARDALAAQADGDWRDFLAARGAELAPGGRLLVQGIGSSSGRTSASRLLHVMWNVAAGLVDDGLLDADTLAGYVFPVYCRNADEITAPLRDAETTRRRLAVEAQRVDEVASPYWEALERDGDAEAYAESYTAFVRAFSESTLVEHLFGPGRIGLGAVALADEYFERFRVATAARPEEGRYEAWVIRTVFRRLEDGRQDSARGAERSQERRLQLGPEAGRRKAEPSHSERPASTPKRKARGDGALVAATRFRRPGDWNAVSVRSRGISFTALYLIVGLVVAAVYDYLDNLRTLRRIGEAVIAVLIWPLLFFGVEVDLR
jgi:SAM dependent carboxyl methyltransferase